MKEIKQINKFYLIVMLLNVVFGGIIAAIIPKLSLIIGQVVLLIVPSIIFIRHKKLSVKETFNLRKFNPANIALVIVLTVLMQYPLSAISQLTAYFFGDQLGFIFDDIVSSSSFFILFIAIAVSPAICEELLFRGLIFSRYKNRVSMKTLIIMNGILFGLFHLNIQQFSYTFLFGILASLIVYLTDSLYPAMIMHFLNNLLSVVEMKFPNSYFSILDYLMPASEGIFYIGVMIILSLLSTVMIYVILKYMARLNGRSMVDYGVYEQLSSVTINFNEEEEKENIIDSMKRYESLRFDEMKVEEDEPIAKHRFLNFKEVFSGHIIFAIFLFIVFSVLVSSYSVTQ